MIDYCVSRNITADVQIIKPKQIPEAYRAIIAKDARYRFVIEVGTA